MATRLQEQSKLERLELQRANAGYLEDVEHSNALTTDQSQLKAADFIKILLAISSIALGTTASYWGFSPPSAILSEINADIGPSDNSSLFSIIWSISASIGIILFGRLSDKFGRRYWILGASLMGLVGGIIACTAKNMNTLVGSNVLLGLSGGVHTCYALTVGEICPNKYKLVGIVICVLPSVIPTGFGAYLALALVHNANWRWCYYIYIMMIVVALVLQFLFYHPPSFQQLHGGKRTVMDELRRVDFVGIFLLVSGLVLFLLGVSWGGQPDPWTSPKILGLLIVGFVVIVAFVFWEIYSTVPNPLVPMHFFKDLRGFVCLNIICAVSGILYVSMSIIWPSQVAVIYANKDPSAWQQNAWLSTTIAFGIWGGIVIFGSIFHLVKHIRIQVIVYTVVCTVFIGALSSGNRNNRGQSAAFSFLATFPAGILEIIPVTLVQLDANDADLGTVFAIIFLMRTAFGSIFVTIFVAILTAKIPVEIAKHVPAAVIGAGLPESSLKSLFAAIADGTAAAYDAVPGITPAILVALGNSLSDSYAAAYAYVYYAAVAVGVVGLIAAVCLKEYDHMLTSHVSRRIAYKDESLNNEKLDPESNSNGSPAATSVTVDKTEESSPEIGG